MSRAPSRGARLARGPATAIILLAAAVVFGLDHLTKWMVTRRLALGGQFPESGPVTIHHVRNTGAAFSLLPQFHDIFLLVAVVVSAYILIAGPRLGGVAVQAILGLILGGAVANAADRAAQGYVVDFLDLHRWPVFNVADCCIVVGIVLAVLVVGGGREGRREGERHSFTA